VTDSQGRTVSFKNAIIILTSNLGSQDIYAHTLKKGASAGQGQGQGQPGKMSEADKLGMHDVVMAKVRAG
jgi:ATP-dependent Clp protease ATP-binding subunit ClpB